MEQARLREVLFVPGWLVTWSMKSILAVVAAALAEISIPKLGFLQSNKEKNSLPGTT